ERLLAVLWSSALLELEHLGLDEEPAFADRLLDGRSDEAFDVGAGRVLGAEAVSLLGVERAGEERAEDGRLDGAPVGLGGLAEHGDVLAGEGERAVVLEEVAVEAKQFAGAEVSPLVHGAPELGEGALDLVGSGLGGVAEDRGERLAGEQSFVLGEHGEDASDQEARDLLLVVSSPFERRGEAGELLGDVAGDPG